MPSLAGRDHRRMNPEIHDLLDVQAQLISRRQALELGMQPHDIRRMLRRRDWRIVHPGVYVAHTGPLGWLERAWAGVLFSWPAALWGDSAIRGAEGPGRNGGDEGPIHVAVDRWRSSLVAPEGIRIHHVTLIARCAPGLRSASSIATSSTTASSSSSSTADSPAARPASWPV